MMTLATSVAAFGKTGGLSAPGIGTPASGVVAHPVSVPVSLASIFAAERALSITDAILVFVYVSAVGAGTVSLSQATAVSARGGNRGHQRPQGQRCGKDAQNPFFYICSSFNQLEVSPLSFIRFIP